MDPWLGYGDLGGPSITGKGDFIINMQQIPIHEKKSRLPENFFPITAHHLHSQRHTVFGYKGFFALSDPSCNDESKNHGEQRKALGNSHGGKAFSEYLRLLGRS
jgi:hypothetical protein